MKAIEKFKPGIKKIAKKYDLRLVILYGSQATGKARKNSDIDIALLGERKINFKTHIDLINEFSGLFQTDDIDVKLLHDTNPLFRYQVTQNGILLYGNETDYVSYKAYAFRDFYDSQSLFKLKEIIIKKRLKHLLVSSQKYGK